MLKYELKRGFKNKLFLAAVFIGIAISIAQIFSVAIPYGLSDDWAYWRSGEKGFFPNSIFNSWLGATSYSIWSVLFYFLLPLIVCLPYSDSLFIDLKSNYVENVIIRGGIKRYFASKLTAVYLSGGIVAIFPQMVNIFCTALFVPNLLPEPAAGTFFVSSSSMFGDLFYSSPWLYFIIFLVISFVIGGFLAVCSLAVTFFATNRFMVLAAPFSISLVAFLVLGVYSGYSPINLLNPAQAYTVEFPIVLTAYALLFSLVGLFFLRVTNDFEALQ